MRQWMLRITAYAERLIDELDGLDWPEGIKLLQRNWIGRSEGAEVDFDVARIAMRVADRSSTTGPTIRVFTTRPDTLYGATYMVLAPEHSLVDLIVTEEQWPAVREYRERTARKSDLERTELAKEKTGVFTGAYAINPVNGEQIPIWIADYVLLGYGTGAIMAVPGARRARFGVRAQVRSADPRGGPAVGRRGSRDRFRRRGHRNQFAGHRRVADRGGKARDHGMAGRARSRKKARSITSCATGFFRGSDIGASRFPSFGRNGRAESPHRALDETELPVVPPPLDDYKPTGTGEPPLAKAKEWVRYSETATRETNMMPQWAGSCWYYLRFCDPQNDGRFVGERRGEVLDGRRQCRSRMTKPES